MRARFCAVMVLLLVPAAVGGTGLSQTVAPIGQAFGQAGEPAVPCGKADFEAVVKDAGVALRDLAQKNLPVLQGKLRQLKDKRSWSNDEFPRQVEQLVSDAIVAAYNKKSEELVTHINGGGAQTEAASATPDCRLLTGLKGALKLLVETQNAKWTHMLGKVDAELSK